MAKISKLYVILALIAVVAIFWCGSRHENFDLSDAKRLAPAETECKEDCAKSFYSSCGKKCGFNDDCWMNCSRDSIRFCDEKCGGGP